MHRALAILLGTKRPELIEARLRRVRRRLRGRPGARRRVAARDGRRCHAGSLAGRAGRGPRPWLLDPGRPAVRHLALRLLEDRRPTIPRCEGARRRPWASGSIGSIVSGGSAGGSSPGRPDIARTRSDVEITPIGRDSSLVRDHDQAVDVVALHLAGGDRQRLVPVDRERRLTSSGALTCRPCQLAHRYSVARARSRSVWLITPTSVPAPSTTGRPEMWWRSSSLAASPRPASARITTGSTAIRSPTRRGACSETTFTRAPPRRADRAATGGAGFHWTRVRGRRPLPEGRRVPKHAGRWSPDARAPAAQCTGRVAPGTPGAGSQEPGRQPGRPTPMAPGPPGRAPVAPARRRWPPGRRAG